MGSVPDAVLVLPDDDDEYVDFTDAPQAPQAPESYQDFKFPEKKPVPITGMRVLPQNLFTSPSWTQARQAPSQRPPSRAANFESAKEAVSGMGKRERRRVMFRDVIDQASGQVEAEVVAVVDKQHRINDAISKTHLVRKDIRERIAAVKAGIMEDEDKAVHFKMCFMKFVGVFGHYLAAATRKGDEFREDMSRELSDATVAKSDGSTLLSDKGKGKIRWALVALSTMAGAKNALQAPTSALIKEVKMDDDNAIKAIERIDVSDMRNRLTYLAGMYMDVREATVQGIGHDAGMKNDALLRYERWMRLRFSAGYFQNLLADYAGYGVGKKIRASVEIFMMEALYIVYIELLAGVHTVSIGDAEHGSLDRIVSDVRYQIRRLFNSSLENMQTRVSDSQYYRNMFVLCAVASTALVGIFIAIPNPPSLVGAVTFITSVAQDSAANFMKNVQGRANDANTSPIIERISRFAVSPTFSLMFKRMMEEPDGLLVALAIKEAIIEKAAFRLLFGGGAKLTAAQAMLAAVVVLASFL